MTNMRGQTLIAMYMVVMMLSVLGGSFLSKGVAVNRHGQIQQLDAETFYLAQGGLEDAVTMLMDDISNFDVDANAPCHPDTDADGDCQPDIATETDVLVTALCEASAACPNSPFPAGSNPRAYSWAVEAEDTERVVVDPDGTRIFVKNYHVTTRAPHPTNPGFTTTLHQVVARRLVYTFQHAVFYDDDLEFLPGPDATLSGRVHSNHDIYLGTHNTLTIDSEYLRSAGGIFNRRKDSSSAMLGDVRIKEIGTGDLELMAGLDSDDATWETESQTRWGGTVRSSVHGVTALSVPAVGTTQPGGFYDSHAGLRVVNGSLSKGDGTAVIECAAATVNAGNQATCVPPGTVTTNPTSGAGLFYDNREGQVVKMTNIDVKRLGGYYDGNSDGVLDPPGSAGNPYASQLPSNGLVYATRDDATGGQEPGIRLHNGSVINRAGGLTVVSNDPVYIQGDYNTVNKKPSAVIADAMNMLSSGWSDANSWNAGTSAPKPLSSRIASTTTVNAAFIAGIETTTSGNYNGGLENYPRFHEDWTNKYMNIRGSFVALWNSQIGTGNWAYGGYYYKAPKRNWDYDSDFSTGPMPPFTPWAVEAVRGAWWRE